MRTIKRKQYGLIFSSILILSIVSQSFGQLHFVSLGSFGSGGGAQTSVAKVLKSRAKEFSVSFLISPGSNFPGGGIADLNDTKWKSAFESPYEGPSMSLPFFTVVGSEDWKGNYSALAMRTNTTYDMGKEDITSSERMIPRWYLPNWWYYYVAHFSDSSAATAAFTNTDGSVGFVFIDTYILSSKFRYPNITKLHWDNLRDTVASAVRVFDWVIAVGDKAILSSGSSKGDAQLSTTLRPFLKDLKVDMYLSGNDPDMEVIEDGTLIHMNCGSASGGQRAGLKEERSVKYFGKAGFCHHILTKETMTTEFIDGYTGKTLGNYTKTHNIRDRSLLSRFSLYKGFPEITYVEIPKGVGQRPGTGRGPSEGPGTSGGPPHEGDLFVSVVGSLGLVVLGGVIVLSSIIGGHKYVKRT